MAVKSKAKSAPKGAKTAKAKSTVRVGVNNQSKGFSAFWRSTAGKAAVVALFMIIGVSGVVWVKAATATYTLFASNSIPKTISYPDAQSANLGVKFKSNYAGEVLGVRFYKGPQNTGTHTGSLWTSDGKLLANVTFTNETASGWQEADFANPINIAAKTTYVVSYFAPHGYYSANPGYFAKNLTSGPLTATKSNNGVYAYSSQSVFPSQSYNHNNYWVDVVFSTSRFTPSPKPLAPTNLQGTSTTSGVKLTWLASSTAGIAHYNVVRNGKALATVDGSTVSYTDATVAAGTTYTYQVSSVDGSGNVSDLSASINVTTASTTPVTPPVVTPPVVTPPVTPPPVTPPTTTGFPGPTNTGYTSAPDYPGKLTTFSGTIQSNTTYKFVDFPNGLEVNGQTNVTFYGCRFATNFQGAGGGSEAALKFSNGSNISFDYDTFEPNTVSAPPVSYNNGYQYGINQVDGNPGYNAGSFTVNHSNFWGFAEAIEIGSSSQSAPVSISNSWFHDTRADGGQDHTDAILVNGAGGVSYLNINHNTIAAAGNTNGIGLQDDSGYTHETVTNNYLSGFGYTVAFGNAGTENTDDTFTGNVFGTDLQPQYGPLYINYGGNDSWTSAKGNVWRNNTILVAPGGFVKDTSATGKFWLPQWTDTGYPTPSSTDWNQ